MRNRMNVYFPPELLKQISDLADRPSSRRLSSRFCHPMERIAERRRSPAVSTGCPGKCSDLSGMSG